MREKERKRERKRGREIDFVLPVMEIHNTPTTYEAALIKKKIKSEFDQASCLN